jgi:hypothetical protein
MVQLPRIPNIEAQRAAMKKLALLVGKWSGAACLEKRTGEPTTLRQTEEVQYKLDGLLLVIEGMGRSTADNKPVLQALGIISYDDETGAYQMRTFNDGRFLETDVRLLEDGKGLTWGFTLGEITTSSVLRINERGEWTERAEIRIGEQAARRLLEITVRRQA